MGKAISNKQAYFNYFIEDKYTAGIVLLGTEVKSIREGKVSFKDAFCIMDKGELFLKGFYIGEYSHGNINNHTSIHDRKLLLKKKELKKISQRLTDKGYTIMPLKLFFSPRNLAKMEIGLAKGKKNYDKRESIKEKDMQRDMKRYLMK